MNITLKDWIIIAIIFAAGLAYIATVKEPAPLSGLQSINAMLN